MRDPRGGSETSGEQSIAHRDDGHRSLRAALTGADDPDLSSKVLAVRTARLQAVTAALARTRTLSEVAQVVASRGPELFDASAALLYVREGPNLHLVHARVLSGARVASWMTVPLDADQPLSHAVRTGQPIFAPDRDQLIERWPHLASVQHAGADLRALVALPLLARDEPAGGLAFSFYEPVVLGPVERDFYVAVADLCAQVVERVRAYEAEQRAHQALVRHQERLELLARAGETLSSSLDPREAMAQLARLAVPTLADWCAIDEIGPDGRIVRLAVEHPDPDKLRMARSLHERYPPNPDAPHGVAAVLRTGQTQWAAEIPDKLLVAAARDEEHLAITRALGLSSYAVVPISARGRVLGALTLVCDRQRLLSEEDVDVAEELARRAGMAIENARLFTAAEAARAQLHDLFQRAPAAIAIGVGAEQRLELANPHFQMLVGERRLQGRPLGEAAPGAAAQILGEIAREVLASGEPIEETEMGIGGRSYNLVCQPGRDPSGRVDRVMTFAYDMTEQVRSRERAEKLAEEVARRVEDAQRLIRALEQTNSELDQFAYVTSHDLRAPLRGITSLAEWIEEDLGEAATDDIRQKLGLLRGRVQRMDGLIHGILTFSRAGRAVEEREEVEVAELLAEVSDLLGPVAPARVVAGSPLPVLHTERLALQQVLQNLVSNALTHAGRPDVEVRVEARQTGGVWEFRVSDDGQGIPLAYHERIWGMFQTLEPRDRVESTGVGLAIVRKVVESRGGCARVDPEVLRGASFVFTWP
jgi:signal transduction histidine kinase